MFLTWQVSVELYRFIVTCKMLDEEQKAFSRISKCSLLESWWAPPGYMSGASALNQKKQGWKMGDIVSYLITAINHWFIYCIAINHCVSSAYYALLEIAADSYLSSCPICVITFTSIWNNILCWANCFPTHKTSQVSNPAYLLPWLLRSLKKEAA